MDEMRPGDDAIGEAVERIAPLVMNGVTGNRLRRRRLAIGVSVLAGVGLFAGGVAVGAAALPPLPNPGANPGVTRDGQGRVQQNQFAIDCYASTGAPAPGNSMVETVEKGAGPSPLERADERSPVSVCAHMQNRGDLDEAISAEATKLIASGLDEGFIRVLGDRVYHFERDAADSTDGRLAFGFDDGTETTAPGIVIASTIRAPQEPAIPSAVCEVASNWVKIYPRNGRSPASTCAAVGLSPRSP